MLGQVICHMLRSCLVMWVTGVHGTRTSRARWPLGRVSSSDVIRWTCVLHVVVVYSGRRSWSTWFFFVCLLSTIVSNKANVAIRVNIWKLES